jgi:hypothetical protein
MAGQAQFRTGAWRNPGTVHVRQIPTASTLIASNPTAASRLPRPPGEATTMAAAGEMVDASSRTSAASLGYDAPGPHGSSCGSIPYLGAPGRQRDPGA